jgi:hypothetical protein
VVVRGESEREVVRDGLELFLEISRLELPTKIVKRDLSLIAKANTLIVAHDAHHISFTLYANYSTISLPIPMAIHF